MVSRTNLALRVAVAPELLDLGTQALHLFLRLDLYTKMSSVFSKLAEMVVVIRSSSCGLVPYPGGLLLALPALQLDVLGRELSRPLLGIELDAVHLVHTL